MGHNQEHHNLLFELSLIFFGMFIIKIMPEASTVTIGFMSAVCFILGKYGKYFSMKKSEIPFRYRACLCVHDVCLSLVDDRIKNDDARLWLRIEHSVEYGSSSVSFWSQNDTAGRLNTQVPSPVDIRKLIDRIDNIINNIYCRARERGNYRFVKTR